MIGILFPFFQIFNLERAPFRRNEQIRIRAFPRFNVPPFVTNFSMHRIIRW